MSKARHEIGEIVSFKGVGTIEQVQQERDNDNQIRTEYAIRMPNGRLCYNVNEEMIAKGNDA